MRRDALVPALIVVACLGCAKRDESSGLTAVSPAGEQTRLSIYVVSYPLEYFAEHIGGAQVEVSFPAPAEGDPAFWSPDAETIAAYQRADVILLNGAGYAKWVELASLPQAKLIDTSAAFRDRYIPLDEGTVHTHGPAGEHSHKGHAFTTWLDPKLAIEQARAVADALSQARSQEADAFRAAFEALEAELRELDEGLAAVAQSLAGEPLLFSHPVYQYLIRRYQLNGKSLHWGPNQVPDDEMWRQLDRILDSHPARWMIWEGPPLAETASALQQRGLCVVVFEPSGNRPAEGDLMTVMRSNLTALQKGCEGSGAAR